MDRSLSPLFSILFLYFIFISHVSGYGESDSSGHPNYQERANHVFLNAVRIAPSQYKSVYMAGYSPSPANILGSTYPARPPVYLENKLVGSAYYHSNDMATNGCFSHSSCDGTDTFVRVKQYYTCSGTLGENIAAGYADPLDTSNQWLCDVDSTGGCAADGSSGDGHRRNMMSNNYRAVGTGYAYNSASTYRHYWTQDFGGTPCSPAPSSPIYGASHRVKSGLTRFIAVYYTNPAVAPSTATVTIGGTTYPLALDIGAAGAGTYFLSQTAGTGCRSYYFTFGSYRYPETGCLVTYGEGTCTTSFDATCSGSASNSNSNSGAAATSSAATTKTATTTGKAVSTTGKAVSTTGKAATSSTTGTATNPGTYYLYSTALQNSWVLQYNSGASVTNSFTYNGVTGLRAVLTNANPNYFIMFNHVPTVTNVWSTLKMNIAASASGTFWIFFNGGYYVQQPVTTSWQAVSISLSSLGNPSTGGTPYTQLGSPNQLVFRNAGSAGITLYLNNVALV